MPNKCKTSGEWLEVKVSDTLSNPYYDKKANTSNQRDVDVVFDDLKRLGIKRSRAKIKEEFFW